MFSFGPQIQTAMDSFERIENILSSIYVRLVSIDERGARVEADVETLRRGELPGGDHE